MIGFTLDTSTLPVSSKTRSSTDTLTIELTGDEEKISALIKLMKEYGIEELVRTGVTALQRGEKTINNSGDSFDM